jgi:hypothetical protein
MSFQTVGGVKVMPARLTGVPPNSTPAIAAASGLAVGTSAFPESLSEEQPPHIRAASVIKATTYLFISTPRTMIDFFRPGGPDFMVIKTS